MSIEFNSPKVIEDARKKSLKDEVLKYEQCVLSAICDIVKSTITQTNIAYSFKGVCCVCKDLASNKCLVPKQMLVNLLKPYLAHIKLKEEDINRNDFKQFIETMDNSVVDLLSQIMKNKKLLLFSKSKNGEVLLLDAEPTEENVIMVSKENYEKLCIQDGLVCGILPMTEKCQKLASEGLKQTQNGAQTIFECENSSDVIKDIMLFDAEGRLVRAVSDRKAEITTAVGKFFVETIL